MRRRDCLTLLSGAALSALSGTMQNPIIKRPIPSSGDLLPSVGVGTWQTFDVGESSDERTPLKEVLTTLLSMGGTVVDSSPMYGRSEEVVGDLAEELDISNKLFIATKVWTNGKEDGIRQMNESFRLMKRSKVELMQIHNLVDWQTHLKTLRRWKEQGKIRYIGLTHYTESAHQRLASIIGSEPVDFIQVNYSIAERNAEKELLPFAREKGVAVLINQPFASGSLFRRVKGKDVPEWAREFDCTSWAQLFLKFILANPAVTCVIPGTSNPRHMADNMGAGMGKLPDAEHLRKMLSILS